jgi:hypothetical protein
MRRGWKMNSIVLIGLILAIGVNSLIVHSAEAATNFRRGKQACPLDPSIMEE